MSNIMMGLNTSAFLATDTMKDRIFGLDWQLVADICVSAIAIFVLFVFLSYVLFNPVRDLLKKRQEFVANELAQATKDKEQANAYKAEYDAKLRDVSKESEVILSETRKKALKRENDIVAEAKEEAQRIIEHAGKQAELEKAKVQNEVKHEMIAVASAMANKIVAASLDENKQNELLDQALEEMGEDTWQN